ncbi:MAG: phosphotransferase [Oscillospiraceae bacterium]|nr:phosphotransferase [Oscillospiraceae bacterium]
MIATEIDINIVQQVINNYFRSNVELEQMKSGVSTYVYRVWHDNQLYYLRVLPEDASFAAEAKAHEIMLECGINVPKPIYFEHKNILLEKSLMLTSEIPGQCIEINGTNNTDLLLNAGKQLALINSIKVDGFGFINRNNFHDLTGEKHTFKEYYYDKLYAYIDSLYSYGFDTDNIKKIMDKAYLMLETKDAFLVHGDFDSTHIFQNDGLYSGIIDFGEIRGSNYLYDLGHFKLHEDFDSFKYLAKGYNDVRKLAAEDYRKIDYLALFVGLGRSKYEHYRNLVKKQLEVLSQSNMACIMC